MPDTRTTKGQARRAQSSVRLETNMLGKLCRLCGKGRRVFTMCVWTSLRRQQKICSDGTIRDGHTVLVGPGAPVQAARQVDMKQNVPSSLRRQRGIYLHALRPHSVTHQSEQRQADASVSLAHRAVVAVTIPAKRDDDASTCRMGHPRRNGWSQEAIVCLVSWLCSLILFSMVVSC